MVEKETGRLQSHVLTCFSLIRSASVILSVAKNLLERAKLCIVKKILRYAQNDRVYCSTVASPGLFDLIRSLWFVKWVVVERIHKRLHLTSNRVG